MSKPINHGTESGYRLHNRYGVPACQPCRTAASKARARRKPIPVDELALTGGRWVYNRRRGVMVWQEATDAA